MKCPCCSSLNVKVIHTDNYRDYIRRKRKCFDCGRRFKTIETYTDKTKREVEQWKESTNCESSTK